MSKQLYEEALADVKRVKQVAEENALRRLTEAVVPRIRDFIDQAILCEDGELDDEAGAMPGMPGALPAADGVAVADPGARALAVDEPAAAAITPPDAEGKVTLDIDAICTTQPGAAVPAPVFGEPVPEPEEAEYEVSLESIEALKPVLSAAKHPAAASKKLDSWMGKLAESVGLLQRASRLVRATPAYGKQIALMISRVDDMYDHVQESVADPARKAAYEAKLEASFQALNKLQEPMTMSHKTNKGQMNEADVTLKLTGLPDDIDLDGVGVDLITGEEDEEGGEGAEGGDGADLGDLDLGDQGGTDGGEGAQMESSELSDDTIVEIDEKMLRREIARMRSLREETKPAAWGDGSGGANILDDFGGGSDEGDAVDQDIADLSPAKGARPLGEQDDQDLEEGQDDLDEQDDQDLEEQDDQDLDQGVHPPQDMAMAEMDGLDQLQNRRKEDEYGTAVSDGHETATWDKRHNEALKRLGFEKKLQERAKSRAAALKKEAAAASAKKDAKRLAAAKKEYAVVAQRFNESVARANKVSKLAAHAAKKLQESRSNSGAKQPAESAATKTLRNKLAETNLFNAKLLFTNKLLQNEQLTSRQKAEVIKQLDKAQTVREAKLVYESLVSGLAKPTSKTVTESRDRTVIGSSSRATRPASTQTLNEGFEAARWAELAGITRR